MANVAFYRKVVVPPALFRRYEFNAQFQYAAVSFQAGVFQAVSHDASSRVSVEFVFPGYAYVGHAGFFRCVVEPGSQPGTVAVDVVEFVVGSVYFCVEAVQVQPTVFEVAVEHVVGVVLPFPTDFESRSVVGAVFVVVEFFSASVFEAAVVVAEGTTDSGMGLEVGAFPVSFFLFSFSDGSDSVVVDVSVSFCPPVMRVHVSPAGFDVQGSVEVFFGVLFFVEFASDSQKPVGSCGVGPGFVSVQVVVQVSSADGAIEAGLGDASVFPQAALEFAVEDEVSCRVQEVCQGQPAFVDGFCSGNDFDFSCFDEVDAVGCSLSAGAIFVTVPFYFVEGLEGAILADGDLSFFVFDVFCCQAGICFVFDDFVAIDEVAIGFGDGVPAAVDVDGAVVEVGFLVFCQGDDGTIFAGSGRPGRGRWSGISRCFGHFRCSF